MSRKPLLILASMLSLVFSVVSQATSSEYPACPPNTSFLTECIGKWDWGEEGTYVGEWLNNQRHGQGRREYGDGVIYVGQWERNEPNGLGMMIWPKEDGDVRKQKYVGNFKDSKRHGHGTYYYGNGNEYSGEWIGGDRTGVGTFTYANGNVVIGKVEKNEFTGFGLQTWKENTSWPDDAYVGNLKDSFRNGYGPYYFGAIGNIFYGSWKAGNKDGYGKYVSVEGIISDEGEYRDDKLIFDLDLSTDFQRERLALVIGNASYTEGPLRNPVNDSRLIADTLRKVGFEVLEYENMSQREMKRAIRTFGDKLDGLSEDAVGLVYYSGHGIQADNTNYLIPVDAKISSEADLDIEAVSANSILKQMEFARNGLNIVILDACRTNPYGRSFRSASKGLARMDAPVGSIVAYATSPGNVAYDGAGNNSPYTKALAEAMLEEGLKIEELLKRVRISVAEDTNNKQIPWESSSLIGDFSFQ
jgi:hypothetical protein